MPGTYEQKFAQLRLFYGYWMTHPGKKLLFMGGEWGQFDEWKDAEPLDWMLLEYDSHRSMHRYVKALNDVYGQQPSLWERDCDPDGFEWIDVNNAQQSVIVFMRRGHEPGCITVAVCNFSHHHYKDYNIGVPESGTYRVVMHSEASEHGGCLRKTPKQLRSRELPYHGRASSVNLELPPFAFILLAYVPRKRRSRTVRSSYKSTAE
jgi:1,4-alpha-glucan branching enzyme